MKKILVRSGMSPLENFIADKIIKKNAIGNNVGNLMYAYSVFRNMTTDQVELVSDHYKKNPEDAAFINETYDAYVLPLANAIRTGFIPSLRKTTALIKKLTIPVYVIGMGMAFPFDPNIRAKRPYDNDVKDFVSAVLEKSSILGLRGQITADYLSHLGFKEDRDHMVIGCPSMYTFGDNIKIRELDFRDSSAIRVNMTPKADQGVLKFLNGLTQTHNNLQFIPQDLDELLLTYAGIPLLGNSVNSSLENYPNSLNSKLYKEGKVQFFLNATTWIDHMKTVDFSIGTRLHGNVVAALAGTPSLTIPIDSRMKELSEYHNFPRVFAEDINENTRLEDLVEKVDFHSVERSHQKNYDRFIQFLDKNGIEHIYNQNAAGVKQPLEKKLETIQLQQPVKPISTCTADEIRVRLENGFDTVVSRTEKTLMAKDEKISDLKQDIKSKKISARKNAEQVRLLQSKMKKMKNSRSWKLTRPLRKIAARIIR